MPTDPSVPDLAERVRGGLLGAACGDALGGPVEGLDAKEIAARHGRVTAMLPYEREWAEHGPWTLAAGSWTDDTRLSLMVAEAVISADGDVVAGDLARVLVARYHEAAHPLTRGFLEEYVGAALYGERKLLFGGHPTNGAVMGNVALGLAHPCDPLAAFTTAFDLAWVTDGYAKESAAIAAAAVAAAMIPGITPREVGQQALTAAAWFRREGPLWPEQVERYTWARFEGRPNDLLVAAALEELDRAGSFAGALPALHERLLVSPLGSEAGQTLAVAVAAFVAAEGDPRAAIEHAVSYGRDCDSYATVAGGIAGAFAGADALPEDWVAAVRAANEPSIDEVAGRLAGVAEGAVRRRAATAAAASSLVHEGDGG